jgi:hypothetical protein
VSAVNPNLFDELLEIRQRLDQLLARWNGAPAARAPIGELFDFGNRAHRIKAEALFDKHQVREKGRAFFYNRVFLAGTMLEDLDAIIERRQAEYRRLYPTAARGRA